MGFSSLVIIVLVLFTTCQHQTSAFVVVPSQHQPNVAYSFTSKRPMSSSSSSEEEQQQQADVVDLFENYTPGETKLLASKDTAVGSGEVFAKAGDVVTMKYEGRLLSNNEKFDGGTFSFKLGQGKVIRGWDEGLEGLQVGGKRTLKIPPNLAYGASGAGDGVIPPNADLVFDCELMSVASGPVAETIANLGLGLNVRTFLILSFILSVILPKFGIGEKGFI
jgi:FKBP-type peptidyl-prolyl cis-trans isomerase